MSNTVRVWDLPTRIFHWALVLCVIGLAVTSQLGGMAMTWHFRFGYTVLTLLLFRLLWGFAGGRWSRFAAFWPTPAKVWHYLRGAPGAPPAVGHSPLGALSVLAMLLFLAAQVGSGLISDDEIANSGPLARFASAALVSQATWYHKHVGKLVLIALVLLHVGAILFYLLRRHDNLIRPMWLGDKELATAHPASRDDLRARALALLLLALCAAAVALLLRLAG